MKQTISKLMRLSILSIVVAISNITYAADSTLAQQLKIQYPNLDFKNIQPTEIKTLYSATLDDQTIYLDATGQYIIFGSIIRLKDQKNLTQELNLNKPTINWSNLPLNDAIKTIKGNGKRQLAIFSDPSCPYCKRLEAELNQLNDVTIYTFLFPIRQESIVPSKRVWCSVNPSYAWHQLINQNILPRAESNCAQPIERNLILGRKLGVDGTPGVIFPNGIKRMGVLTKQDIEKIWQMGEAK